MTNVTLTIDNKAVFEGEVENLNDYIKEVMEENGFDDYAVDENLIMFEDESFISFED